MESGRVCYESASAVALEARRRRVDAWAAEMKALGEAAARDLAKRFDQSLELDAYLPEAEKDELFGEVGQYLREFDVRRISDLPDRLPVFPEAAREVLGLAWEPETSMEDLLRLARRDAVLAGAVISASNSSLYGPSAAFQDLPRALMHLGAEAARNVLLTAAMREVFKHPKFRVLWQHSIETAEAGDRLAKTSGVVDRGAAFLCCLLHDIGRLALLLAPAAAVSKMERLALAGCPLEAAERAVFGIAHGALGADILDAWRFDERLKEAARFHHSPERTESVHAALVYASEFQNDSGEDLPSLARLQAACGALNLDVSAVVGTAA